MSSFSTSTQFRKGTSICDQRTFIPFEVCPIILKCCKEENIRRAINDGRDMERIERGIKNTFHFYDEYAYPNIDSTYLQPEQAAEKIIEILNIRLTGNEG